jgi:hypothetical protein
MAARIHRRVFALLQNSDFLSAASTIASETLIISSSLRNYRHEPLWFLRQLDDPEVREGLYSFRSTTR